MHYGKALELDHKLVAAYDNRARAYRAEGDLDKALADFDEAMELEFALSGLFFSCPQTRYLP
jgi:hypothetical protein